MFDERDNIWLAAFIKALGVHSANIAAPAINVAPTLTAVPVAPDGSLITARLLLRLGVREPDAWVGPLAAACAANGINTPLRLAAFLANIMHETACLSLLVENLNYTPASLLKQWPSHFTVAAANKLGRTPSHPADQMGIAELAYRGRGGNKPAGSGDGALFCGHGGMMTTFRGNYTAFAKQIGWTRPVEQLPAYLETREGAVTSAAVFWNQAHCNAPADRGDIDAVRRIVNGGSIGLAEVRVIYATAKHALGV